LPTSPERSQSHAAADEGTAQEPRLRNAREKGKGFKGVFGRGTRIRTLDLQYPKLPRYQAALYPEYLGNEVDTRLMRRQQGWRQTAFGRSFIGD
jgi:hypothetical protein